MRLSFIIASSSPFMISLIISIFISVCFTDYLYPINWFLSVYSSWNIKSIRSSYWFFNWFNNYFSAYWSTSSVFWREAVVFTPDSVFFEVVEAIVAPDPLMFLLAGLVTFLVSTFLPGLFTFVVASSCLTVLFFYTGWFLTTPEPPYVLGTTFFSAKPKSTATFPLLSSGK